QSTNEELETTNEELQSTNEELETTVEELQAINAELGAVNSELEKRSEELNMLDALHATVVDSVDGSIIVLDPEGVVRTWNLGASRMWGLRAPEAIGHALGSLPIGDVAVKASAAIRDALVARRRSTIDNVTYALPGGAEQQTTVTAAP